MNVGKVNGLCQPAQGGFPRLAPAGSRLFVITTCRYNTDLIRYSRFDRNWSSLLAVAQSAGLTYLQTSVLGSHGGGSLTSQE